MSYVKHANNTAINQAGTDILEEVQRPLRFMVGLNLSTAVTYIRLYTKAKASVTIGSDTTEHVIAVPPSSGFVFPIPEKGLDAPIRSAWACTTASGATGSASAFIYYGWGA